MTGAPDEIRVEKLAAYIPISTDMAMDMGLIPDTRPPVRYPWWTRLRWWLQNRRRNLRIRLGCWIAGIDPEEHLW